MPKQKFSLDPNPTFKANAGIPVHGSGIADVEFTFRHRTRSEFLELFDGIGSNDTDSVDVIMDIVCGWELTDEFNRSNVEKLLQNFMGSAKAIIEAYSAEMIGQRLGN